MSKEEVCNVLEEFMRWRNETYEVGSQVRLKHDHALHTITRVEEYDYRAPFQLDKKMWVSRRDLDEPDPDIVDQAIQKAIEILKGE